MMTLRAAAQATDGTAPVLDIAFAGVATDSRRINRGDLFIALKGDKFDGHDFVSEVLRQGAIAAMVNRDWLAEHGKDVQDFLLLAVDDTRLALGQLAAHWRGRFDIPLIGITGSNGKTTTKEMCAAILGAHLGPEAVLATTGNLNNDIGLPLTLLRLRSSHRAAVIEMGMNHPGEIAYLTHIARPTVALVTNAQRAHLEGLGTLTEVARAKGEIFEGLEESGVAVINADDPHAELWRQVVDGEHLIGFGLKEKAEVTAAWYPKGFGGRLDLDTPWGSIQVELAVPGRHNAMNALAAAAATLAAGVPLATVASALAGYTGVKGRLQRRWGEKGTLIIDDTYNANPDSMRAALDVLADVPGRRVFVMGDMGEVGEASGQFHDEVGGYAKSRGIDRLLALGESSETAVRNFGEGGRHFRHLDDLLAALRKELDPGTTVLVKGSRFMRMERVVEAIADKMENKHAS